MKKVFKYPIDCNSVKDGVYTIAVASRENAKPICAMVQDGVVCVWAEVDTDMPRASPAFHIHCTGTGFGRVPRNSEYLGSVIHHGEFVWHLYWSYPKLGV